MRPPPAYPALSGASCSPATGPPPGRLLPPGLGEGPETLARHLSRRGAIAPIRDGAARTRLLAEIERAGLLGRGGASFPTARKLAAVAAERRPPVVIANGTEGEPASAKDKVLLARAPHLVLDGAVLAAEVLGAVEAFIVVHRAVREFVEDAVGERSARHLDRVRLRVVSAAEGFVAGEASAVAHFVERGVPLPRRTPPRLSHKGVLGRPTLVQNVETLAHLALIARHGAAWYRSIGTASEPGSTLVTVLGAVGRPGVYEIALGTQLSDVIERAGGACGPLQALLLGGYFGSWVRASDALARPFSNEGLASLGAGVGAGMIAALASDVCGVVETARVARYLAGESAGQCGPCVFGLPALAGHLEDLARGDGFDAERLEATMSQLHGRGACSHPDGAVGFTKSALSVFGPEIARHANGWCCGSGAGAPVLPVPLRRAP